MTEAHCNKENLPEPDHFPESDAITGKYKPVQQVGTVFFAVFRLVGVVDRKHRFIFGDAKGLWIGNGVVHIQGTASHFLLKKLRGELLKTSIRGGMGSYKGQSTGEGAEKTNTYE